MRLTLTIRLSLRLTRPPVAYLRTYMALPPRSVRLVRARIRMMRASSWLPPYAAGRMSGIGNALRCAVTMSSGRLCPVPAQAQRGVQHREPRDVVEAPSEQGFDALQPVI